MRATLKINMSRTHQTPENPSGKERGTWDSTQAKRECVCVQYDITVHALSILDKRAGPMSHFFAGSVPCAKKCWCPPIVAVLFRVIIEEWLQKKSFDYFLEFSDRTAFILRSVPRHYLSLLAWRWFLMEKVSWSHCRGRSFLFWVSPIFFLYLHSESFSLATNTQRGANEGDANRLALGGFLFGFVHG